MHLVFHVSQLKPFIPCYTPVFAELPKVADLSTMPLESELILDRRLVKKGNHAIVQVLVKWEQVPASSATWEDFEVVRGVFLIMLLGDKQLLQPGEMSGMLQACSYFEDGRCVLRFILYSCVSCGPRLARP